MILKSASKLVFLAITATVCVSYLFLVLKGTIVMDPKDYFALVLMVFTFYFADKKRDSTDGTDVK